MSTTLNGPRPTEARARTSVRGGFVVPAMWGVALMGVALAGMPGRSLDALFTRLQIWEPPGFEPAMLTGMLLFGIPVMMVAAILLSVAVYRE